MATVVASPRDDVRQKFREMNQRKRAPGISDSIKESAAPVFIFNIFNREYHLELGNFGRVRIPACAPGERYAGPVAYGGVPYVQGLLPAEFDQGNGDGQMGVVWERGEDVARDIVGIGSSFPELSLYTTDRSHWGVFISTHATRENPVPSDAEIEEAKKKLTAMMMKWFDDGQRLAKEGHIDRIGPNHREAAQFLNQKVEWSAKSIPMGVCPGCAEPLRPGAIWHECGAIIDPDKALENGIISQEKYDGMMAAKKRRLNAEAEIVEPPAAEPESPAAASAPKAPQAQASGRPPGPQPGKPILQR